MRRLAVDNADVVALYKEHKSTRIVSRLLGCTSKTVWNRLQEAGVEAGSFGLPQRTAHNKLHLDECAVLRVYKKEKSQRRMAKQFNCSVPTITNVLKKYGVPRDGKPKHTVEGKKRISEANKRTRAAGKLSGKNHWRWQGGKKKAKCCICGKTVSQYRISKHPVCSKKCNSKRASEALKGSRAPWWKGDALLYSCLQCGKVFRRSGGRSHQKFCDSVCFYAWNRGANAANWKGGKKSLAGRIRETSKYAKWRQKVLVRDDFTCTSCDQVGGRLDVHHVKALKSLLLTYEITSVEEALSCRPLWRLRIGKALCKDCHDEKHPWRKALYA